MEVKPWAAPDYRTLSHWLEQRGAYIPYLCEMPKAGWMAWEGDTPIACAFLRMVEGGTAQLDGLATNPILPGEMRHFAIDAVVQEALQHAKAIGIKSVYSISVDEGTLLRSHKHGFVRVPHVVIVHNPSRSGA